jgi:hypothetical protein
MAICICSVACESNLYPRQIVFEGSLNQVSAALVCKNTFRLQLSAAKIRMKAHGKLLLRRIRKPREIFLKESTLPSAVSFKSGLK